MPIACTRCGASEEGEIITPPIAFAFTHEKGCGHGIGPLTVVKGKTPKKAESKTESKPKKEKSKKLKKGEVPWETNDTSGNISTVGDSATGSISTTATEEGT